METITKGLPTKGQRIEGSGRKPRSYYINNGLPVPGSPEYLKSKVEDTDWTPDQDLMNQVSTLELVDAPINEGRGDRRETLLLKASIDKTLINGMAVGKAFVIPKIKKHVTKKHLALNYPEMAFRATLLGNGREFVRFTRVR